MYRIKAIIVDDERSSRSVLRKLLETEFDSVVIVAEASNADEAYDMIKIHQPDLIFLDIQMPKASGFSLLRRFDSIPFEIIFVTSFDNYAINAIKFSALDYLLKPVEIPDLANAVNKAISVIERNQNRNLHVINLIHNLDSEVVDKKIAVHQGDKVKFVNKSNIVYIEADRRYSHIYTDSGECFITAKYLKEYEDFLGEQSGFIKINKSQLINVAHIQEYAKGDPFIITLLGMKQFEVSRRRKAEILEKLKQKK